jgi:carbon monoxide dehydrogenase subunit G
MRFENSFDVDAPIDEVFETLLDLEKVAPAMPGAQVTEKVSDDAYKVAIKVKLGPMTMNYRGDVEIRDKDPEAHRAVLHVKAREARGQGTATADVTQRLEERDGRTQATIEAEVQLAGRAAAMGRGLIEDVSAKLVQQFADNLSEMLGRRGAEADADDSGGGSSANGGGATAAAEAQSPGEAQPAGEAAATVEREAARPAASAPPPQADPAAGEDSLDALGLATGIARDKLREPRTLGLVVLGVLVAYLLARRSAR